MEAGTNEPGRQCEDRVLVLAPRGRNAELIERSLRKAGIPAERCADVPDLCEKIGDTVGAAIVCEDALTRKTLDLLVGALGRQPPWSELPLLVLTGGGKTTRGSLVIASALGPRGNVTLIERPARIITLVSATRTALRARRRQYEIRDLLAREQSARSQAEAASRAKDQFLATLSHELRTPLNPVLMTVSAMLEDPRLPQSLREDVDVVKRNIELESRLIDDLLDLTRIARGKLELQQEAVNAHEILRHALVTCCESDILRKRLRVVSELRAEHPYVWGDAARLSQVFWNLIKNAVKFTSDGGQITVETQNSADGEILIRVKDTGIGIEPKTIDRIFDAFEQADRSITRQFGGLGLGLAICKALISLHGGRISAESPGKNQGAVFTVRLATVPRPKKKPQESPGVEETATPLRVLLVEDHESTAQVMARLLGSLGHQVTVAHDVAAAIEAFDAGPFELLISDLGLPDGTGFELVQRLRASSQVPAIAVSGYGMEEDVRQSRDAGFDEHLVKPIDLKKLKATIGRLVHRKG